MHIPQRKVDQLVKLADLAIKAAMQERENALEIGASWLIEDCDHAIQNFQAIKDGALNGSLQPSNGAGLGISRALIEWNASDKLYSAGCALENYFRDKWRT